MEGEDTQAANNEELTFESGKIVVSTGDIEVLEINLKGKEIGVNVENKDFIKRAISISGEIRGESPTTEKSENEKTGNKKKSGSSLAMLKTVAETLSRRGITVTISYQSHTVVTLGSGAHPWLSQLITKTNAVAINSLLKLIEMIT
jgi:hypothetical protein